MKAAVQVYGLDRTGGMIVWYRYLEWLRDEGVELAIHTLGTPGDRRFLPVIDGVSTTFHGLRSKPYKALVRVIPGDLGFPGREVRTLLESRPDDVDLRLATNTLTVASSIDGETPVLHHVQHDERLFEPEGRRRKLVAELLCSPDVVRTANCTWVANQLDDMRSTVARIIPPAIDHEVFVAGPEPELVENRPLRVLTLGKSVAWKGLVDVVEAVRRLGMNGTDVTLVSYGPNRPRVPRNVRLEHHGFVDGPTLATLIHGVDVAVSASWYESFPLPPIEAMACGTPVICTRLGTEDYAEHETNSLVVEAKNPAAIAASVERLATDHELAMSLGKTGLETAERFQWDRACREFSEEAHRVAGLAVS